MVWLSCEWAMIRLLIVTNLCNSYAYTPLLILFEKEPPMPDEQDLAEGGHAPEAANTALLIPCVRMKQWSANFMMGRPPVHKDDADIE